MTRIGILGLGRMGAPIAARLRAAGFEVHGFDPVSGGSLPAVVSGADVLLTVLPGVPEFSAAVPEIRASLRAEAVWVDLTSNDPRVAREAAEGVAFVGAPMAGGPVGATSGSLRFFTGGVHVERVRPLLETLGMVEHQGDSIEAGYTAKLLANLLWFGQVVAVTEALLLGRALGMPAAELGRALAASAGGSAFLDEYLDRLVGGDNVETFGIDRVVEELDVLASLAAAEGVPFELSALVGRLHREALSRFGAAPGELLAARLLEERAGRPLASQYS